MCGPISGKEYANKWVVTGCCCGCSLRTGSLLIGWLYVITAILYVISIATDSHRSQTGYAVIGNIILTLLTGLLIVVGIYKNKPKALWVAVYIELFLTVWSLIFAIIYFVNTLYALGAISIIIFLLNLYFFIVLRAYAYQMDGGVAATSNPA